MTATETSQMDRPSNGLHEFLTKADVARILKVTPRTVSNWMKTGCLAYYKIGRSIRFRLGDLEAHLETQCRILRRRSPLSS